MFSCSLVSLQAKSAITLCRYCLWILGNGPTLEHSGTVWRKLVNDAKDRGCFHNAEDDDNLGRAITISLVELGKLDLLQKNDSLLFKKAPWKVCKRLVTSIIYSCNNYPNFCHRFNSRMIFGNPW